MKTTVAPNKMDIRSVSDIRKLYQDLKNARLVRNWGEFADKIGYDRTYVSRVVNEHEPFTPELKEKIKDTFLSATKNVPLGEIWLSISEKEFQQMILEEIRQLKATANVVKLTAAKIAAKVNTSNIEEEYQTLLKLIDAEADRLLELDKKKYGVKPPGS
jgi:hypothetical protein